MKLLLIHNPHLRINNIMSRFLLMLLALCLSGNQVWALTIIDPYPNAEASTIVSFSGQIAEGMYGARSSWPAGFPPEGAVYDTAIPISQVTYGAEMLNRDLAMPDGSIVNISYASPITNNDPMPASSLYARSTVDTEQGFMSSETNHPGSTGGNASGVFAYTRDLPTSASLSFSGSQYATNSARVGIQVYATTPTGRPLTTTWLNEWYGFMPDMSQGDILGSVVFSNENGSLSWQVEQWSWQPSSEVPPTLNSTIIAQGNGELDFSLLSDYVSRIVDGRTNDYYYAGFANVYTLDRTGAGSVHAQLNYDTDNNAAPVPEPATMLLLGSGLLGLAGFRKKIR